MDRKRAKALDDFIWLKAPMPELQRALNMFPWDFDAGPKAIRLEHLENSLRLFLNGELQSQDLEEWADTIVVREDLEVSPHENDALREKIELLANPTINLESGITPEVCRAFLTDLTEG